MLGKACQKHDRAGHTVLAVRKQAVMDTDVEPSFSSYLIWILAYGCFHLHSEWVFGPKLTLSWNTLIDTPRGGSPR